MAKTADVKKLLMYSLGNLLSEGVVLWFAIAYFTNILCIVNIMKSGVSTFRSSTGGVSALGRTNLHFVDPGVKVNGQYYRDIFLREIFCPILSSTPITSHFNRMGTRRIGLAKLSNF